MCFYSQITVSVLKGWTSDWVSDASKMLQMFSSKLIRMCLATRLRHACVQLSARDSTIASECIDSEREVHKTTWVVPSSNEFPWVYGTFWRDGFSSMSFVQKNDSGEGPSRSSNRPEDKDRQELLRETRKRIKKWKSRSANMKEVQWLVTTKF